MIGQFQSWLNGVSAEIDNFALHLGTTLETEPEALISDLTKIEALSARCGELRAVCGDYLDRAKLFFLPPKDSGMTESERRITMESETAEIRKVLNILESYQDAIRQRIMLGQSVLAYQRQFAEPRISSTQLPRPY